jgi:hypothetical protein
MDAMSPMLLAAIPQPDPMPIPAPPWLVWFLLLLTFLLHLLPMNLLLGGSVLGSLSRHLGGPAGREHHDGLSKFFSKALPVTTAGTVTMGVAPLLLVQVLYGRLFFASSILMAWYWLAVIPLLCLGYYGTYLIAFKESKLGGALPVVSWASTLMFVAIGFMFVNNMSLMLRPEVFLEKYQASAMGWHLNLGDPTLFPRFLHMITGALAVTGMIVAVYGMIKQRADEPYGRWLMRYGSLWFVVPTVVTILFGLWWLIALPREVMLQFMGQDMLATAALGLGILFALGALMMMVMAIQAKNPAGLIRGSAITLLITLVFMILMRDRVRAASLEMAGYEPVGWVDPQWGILILFLLLLVAAIATVIWMVVKLAKGEGATA